MNYLHCPKGLHLCIYMAYIKRRCVIKIGKRKEKGMERNSHVSDDNPSPLLLLLCFCYKMILHHHYSSPPPPFLIYESWTHKYRHCHLPRFPPPKHTHTYRRCVVWCVWRKAMLLWYIYINLEYFFALHPGWFPSIQIFPPPLFFQITTQSRIERPSPGPNL